MDKTININVSVPIDIKESLNDIIYVIRGKQVMLDVDLAVLYGYEVKRLNEQVKRNLGRFPDDFMFQLTKEEIELVKSQIATSPKTGFFSGNDGGRRKPPYAFTEQGVYMLATVLKGDVAEQQSIKIIFVKTSRMINHSFVLSTKLCNISSKSSLLHFFIAHLILVLLALPLFLHSSSEGRITSSLTSL